jgi:hypothetical protein
MGESKAVLSQKRTQFELPEQACSHYPQGAGTRPRIAKPRIWGFVFEGKKHPTLG